MKRVVDGLLFEYDFRRADCVAGVFPPSGGHATFGSLQKAAGGISCLDGVGVQAATARPAAALVSNGSAARVLSALVASSSFTLELWMSSAEEDIANTGSRLPILALGRGVAEHGVAEADCYEERHALLVAQRGAFLEVELLEQLYTDSRGTTSPSCFAAEAYADTGERSLALSPALSLALSPAPSPAPSPDRAPFALTLSPTPVGTGAVFSSAEALYHVVVTAAPHAPLRIYVDAVQLTDLQDPLRHFPATYPIDVDFGLWPPEGVLAVAPKTRPLSAGRLWGKAAPGGWSGRLHMLAAYSRALSSEQVAANHAAWLVDSAPLTPDESVTATEDAPLRLDMAPRASTPFDAAYSPRPPRPLTLYISSLPALGTLHADDGTGRAGAEIALSPRDLPLELPRSGFVWYRPPKDVHSAGAEASAALRYFASNGVQASLPGTLSLTLTLTLTLTLALTLTLTLALALTLTSTACAPALRPPRAWAASG